MKKLILAASVLGLGLIQQTASAQTDVTDSTKPVTEMNKLQLEKQQAELLEQKARVKDKLDKIQSERRQSMEMQHDGKSQTLIIRTTGDKDITLKVEVKGDKVTINGKPLEQFKDENVTINKRKMIIRSGDDVMELALDGGLDGSMSRLRNMPNIAWNDNGGEKEVKRTFLGVTTEAVDDGAKINSVSEESAAEKAGLKEADVIYKVDAAKIGGPDDLAEYISSKKPKDQVTVYYKRNGKDATTKATLGERVDKTVRAFGFSMPRQVPGQDLNNSLRQVEGLDLREMPIENHVFNGNLNDLMSEDHNGFTFLNARPKIGLKIQDLEEGSGVKVLDADKDSPAEKAGLKKEDIITEINGKKINNTDEAREQLKPEEGKNSYKIKALRNGTEMNFDVKIPKKLKTANL